MNSSMTLAPAPPVFGAHSDRLADSDKQIARARRTLRGLHQARAGIVGLIAEAHGASGEAAADQETQRLLRSDVIEAVEALRFSGTFTDNESGQRLWDALNEVRDALLAEAE